MHSKNEGGKKVHFYELLLTIRHVFKRKYVWKMFKTSFVGIWKKLGWQKNGQEHWVWHRWFKLNNLNWCSWCTVIFKSFWGGTLGLWENLGGRPPFSCFIAFLCYNFSKSFEGVYEVPPSSPLPCMYLWLVLT